MEPKETMTLQQLIDWARRNNVASDSDLQFNISDGGPECYITVEESALCHATDPETGNETVYINQY